ncbi:MAG: sugar ABC transporter permease [Clostridia bacterium]|nr:sugar ABC transporter permease [Clostridia bacterium]
MLHGQRFERYKDFACVMPALFFLALFVYYPLLDLVRISFTNWNLLKDDYAFVGIKNYKWLFAGSGVKQLKNTLSVTLRYTFWEVLFSLAGGLLLALLFDRMTRYFNVLRALVFMPKYIATATSAIVFVWMLNGPHGFVNWVLSLFKVAGPDWLADAKYALAGILMLTFWRSVGYAMMIYLSAMKGIPQDYYEAASIDGADGVHCFRYITLPMLAPTTLFLLVTTFISSMKVFQSVDVMTSGGPYDSTMVMVQWVYDLSFRQYRIDRAAAGSLVFFAILLLFTVLTMRYSNKSVNYDQ